MVDIAQLTIQTNLLNYTQHNGHSPLSPPLTNLHMFVGLLMSWRRKWGVTRDHHFAPGWLWLASSRGLFLALGGWDADRILRNPDICSDFCIWFLYGKDETVYILGFHLMTAIKRGAWKCSWLPTSFRVICVERVCCGSWQVVWATVVRECKGP